MIILFLFVITISLSQQASVSSVSFNKLQQASVSTLNFILDEEFNFIVPTFSNKEKFDALKSFSIFDFDFKNDLGWFLVYFI